ATAQAAEIGFRCGQVLDTDRDTRIFSHELQQYLREYRSQETFKTGEAQFAGFRIGKMFDVPRTLRDLAEDRVAVSQQRLAIEGDLHPFRAPVEERHAIRMLEIGDPLRH